MCFAAAKLLVNAFSLYLLKFVVEFETNIF